MEEKNVVKGYRTPKAILARMQVVRFGKICFNLQFVAVAVMLASVLSILFVLLYYIVVLCITMVTLGIIYVLYPEAKSLWAGGEKLSEIMTWLGGTWQYTVPVALALSLSSIILLLFDKQEKHVARIVISALVAVFTIVFLIVKATGGAA